MLQAFEVNFDGFSTEFEKCLDYLCFTFSSTLAKQSSPLLLIENKLLKEEEVTYDTKRPLCATAMDFMVHKYRCPFVWNSFIVPKSISAPFKNKTF